jgi:hypothetical protein
MPNYPTQMSDVIDDFVALADEYGDVAVVNTWAVSPNPSIMISDEAVAGTKMYSSDGTHLTVPGYYWFSSTIWTLIESQFDRKPDWPFKRRVNFFDFAILANSWRQNNPLVDLTPAPAGDGIIDIMDLAVLCDNWLTEK